MTINDTLFNIINYFHKDKNFNRVTFGLHSSPTALKTIIRWRLTDFLLLVVLTGLYFFAYALKPFQRQFYINDLTISHPFAEHERVTGTQLFVYATWFPLTLLVAFSLVFTKPKYKIYVAYVSALGLLLAVTSTSVFTDIVKNHIGRHRPDFLARCIPKEGTPKDVLVYAKDVCTTDNLDRLYDGFRTTPSGHSSISFAGLFYTSLWLSGQLVVKNELVGSWRTIVSWIPAFGALLIALSRTEDYRHHFVDVIIGSIIGITIGSWSYFRLFPSLDSSRSYYPLLIVKEIQEEEEEDKGGELQEHLTDINYSRIRETV
ncbi:diacylglycerol pyrophosphate phosphatase [Scheffersomyces xylosifermentans]|uniref:diacylglycerol pyrophosphate phosphatase n=1 Tax=Scheffersomyces xylosifermentans TaxID=1304137 RepID=UPI00315C8971